MSILTNRPDNVRRPPDWRWQRAGEILDHGGRVVRGRDDQLVKEVCKFRRLLARCQDDYDRLTALDACPALFEAYSLFDASESPVEHKWELEARLLAREPMADITRKTGIPAETVAKYEQVFFDVYSRLDAPSLIFHTVIGRSVQSGLAEREYDVLWKLFGYSGGPLVLDAYVYKMPILQTVVSPEGVRAFYKEQTKDTIGMKACVTALTTPINWQTRELILGTWERLLQMEVNAGAAGIGQEAVMANLDGLMKSLVWTKHRPGVDDNISGPAASFETSGVRLRAAELAFLSTGQTPEGLDHLLGTVQFPTKGKDDDNA